MKYISILSLALLLVSCGTTSNKESETNSTQEQEIVNKYWKLITLEGQAVEMTEDQEREQYFTLKSDSTISGFGGCNQFSGTYELKEGKRIRVHENLAVTMMACPNLTSEQKFLDVFQLVDNYTINGDTLYLNVGRRAPLAVFQAIYF